MKPETRRAVTVAVQILGRLKTWFESEDVLLSSMALCARISFALSRIFIACVQAVFHRSNLCSCKLFLCARISLACTPGSYLRLRKQRYPLSIFLACRVEQLLCTSNSDVDAFAVEFVKGLVYHKHWRLPSVFVRDPEGCDEASVFEELSVFSCLLCYPHEHIHESYCCLSPIIPFWTACIPDFLLGSPLQPLI